MPKNYDEVAKALGLKPHNIRYRVDRLESLLEQHITQGLIDKQGQRILEAAEEFREKEKGVTFAKLTEDEEFMKQVEEIEQEMRPKKIEDLRTKIQEQETLIEEQGSRIEAQGEEIKKLKEEIKELEKHLHLVYREIGDRNRELQAQKEIIEVKNKMIARREQIEEWDESLKAPI